MFNFLKDITIYLFLHNCPIYNKHNQCLMILPGLKLLFSICKIQYKIKYKQFLFSIIPVYIYIINMEFSVYAHISLSWNGF